MNNKYKKIKSHSYIKIHFLLFNLNILTTGHPQNFIFTKSFKSGLLKDFRKSVSVNAFKFGHSPKFMSMKCKNFAI